MKNCDGWLECYTRRKSKNDNKKGKNENFEGQKIHFFPVLSHALRITQPQN